MKIFKYALAVIAAMGCAAFGAYLYSRVDAGQTTTPTITPTTFTGQIGQFTAQSYAPTDFTEAAEASVNAVVHVKILQETRSRSYDYSNPFYEFFFGPQLRQQQQQSEPQLKGSGSGVIISSDGYIVTNNHVIEEADKIEVVLNDRRTYTATLIGTDPTTDIALIKIDETGLSTLQMGNSDAVKVGEWVLAVGNPFNLTSTVTAGIVSAKSRQMGIINNSQNMGIEAFIQTDAAVNPGNSGGALVNTRGELIGINTAIASTTGAYSGYSFAVPSNIVQKVAADLKEYGEVQRALLGVTISNISPEIQKRLGLEKLEGACVMGVADGGAAKEAGILVDDVITAVDDEAVTTVPELQEKIGRKRPGESVKITLIRAGKTQQYNVTLRNIRGTTGVVTLEGDDKLLGATLENVSQEDLQQLRLRNGVRVTKLGDGKLKASGVREGFIITKANRIPVASVKDFEQIVATASEGLFLSGMYPNGKTAYYAINLEE